MDEQDNPYEILGVSESASPDEIRKAYRKAALLHHPDRQATPLDKQRATVTFAKISNAYELLSDANQRRQYDLQQQGRGMPNFMPGFDDDFFHSSFHQAHPFHDPFQVFEQVFRQEFGGSRQQSPMSSFFGGDPFAGMMGGMPGMMGGGMMDPFENMFASMQRPPNGLQQQSFFSSSTTSGGPGQSVSMSTTTRIVNGKAETVTERVVRHADGRVERSVQSSGNLAQEQPPPIENGKEQQLQQQSPSQHESRRSQHESSPSQHDQSSPSQHESSPSLLRGCLPWCHKKRPKQDEGDPEQAQLHDTKKKHKRKEPPSQHNSD